MKEPSFQFGEIVVPTLQAFKNGVFRWSDRENIVGVVVWADDMTVRVVRRGNRNPRDYSSTFWALDE